MKSIYVLLYHIASHPYSENLGDSGLLDETLGKDKADEVLSLPLTRSPYDEWIKQL